MSKATLSNIPLVSYEDTPINTTMKNLSGFSGLLLNEIFKPKPKDIEYSIGGDKVISKTNTKNSTKIDYNLSDTEKSLLDYTNNNLLKGLENINVFSDDLQQSINKQVEAYKNKGLEELNTTYVPMFRELKNDIASRFGNLDNSIFLDNLDEIEKNRTKAITTLTENILSKQQELYEAEMQNRYNYLEALTNTNSNIYDKILSYLQLANN